MVLKPGKTDVLVANVRIAFGFWRPANTLTAVNDQAARRLALAVFTAIAAPGDVWVRERSQIRITI